MQTAADRVSEEAMALPADARIILVDKILASLNLPSQPDIDRLWAEEAERRIGEMERGEVIPVPAEEVLVVMKGSKILFLTFSSIPDPLSATSMMQRSSCP